MKIILAILICVYSNIISSKDNNLEYSFKTGMFLYKKAKCNSCHFWHANGGNSHGGAAPSLRTTALSENELLTVIKCGRLGTNMPFFSRNYKEDKSCNHIEDNIMPLKGTVLLRDNEINYLVLFINNEIKNKPITKHFCIEYFNKNSSTCENFQ